MNNADLMVLRHDAESTLTSECAIALGAYLSGYRAANSALAHLLAAVDDHFPGPPAASVCLRAALRYPTTRSACRAVVDALVAAAADRQELAPKLGVHGTDRLIDIVRAPIRDGRPGMVLGEVNVSWLADFASGRVAGLRRTAPMIAVREAQDLLAFAEWLNGALDDDGAGAWHTKLRVFYGSDFRGVEKFVDYWDEFEAERKVGNETT